MSKNIKNLLWITAVVILTMILIGSLLPLIFDWQIPFYSHMFPSIMFPLGGLGMVAFWGLIIYGGYLLIKRNDSEKKPSDLDILKKRLSNGEISIEEYEKVKRTLEDNK